MGTIYSVACRDCKITRDLDKFYAMSDTVDNRDDACRLAVYIGDAKYVDGETEAGSNSFRAALLISFMWKHKGHNCTVFNEHDDELSEELDPFYKKCKEDFDYWRLPPRTPDPGEPT